MIFETFFGNCKKLFELNSLSSPSKEEALKLFDLTNIMLETNKVMNLTAIKEENSIILRHYVDSLLISQLIPKNSKVIDIGCGAGFPTLPLAIFRHDLSITAVDSTAKRIDYVNSTSKKLELDNVTAIAARAEELGHDHAYRESFDIATARAVASLPILSELCLPLVKNGGSFIAMKGSKADEEFAASQKAIQTCGGKTREILRPSLINQDDSLETRYLIQIDKLSATPQNYPRHFSKISKKPL